MISRASDVQKKFLLRNGADKKWFYPAEKQVAKVGLDQYTDDHILDYMEWMHHAILKWKCRKNGLEKQ